MLAAIYWTPGSYLVLPAKAMASFLFKLSEPYSIVFRIKGKGMSKNPEVGYEASWTGAGRSFDEMGEAR